MFSQDSIEFQTIDISKFQKEYQTAELSFEFMYICDETFKPVISKSMSEEETRYLIYWVTSQKKELKELMRFIGNESAFYLRVTALKITEFDPAKLVFVQGKRQFEIQNYTLIRGRTRQKIYPTVLILIVFTLSPDFDPTIPTTIWYKEEKLGDFIIPAKYKNLVFPSRKPVKIKMEQSFAEEKGVYIEFMLEDKYGVSTRWDGDIKYRLYDPIEEKKLLYEGEKKVSKEDFKPCLEPGKDILDLYGERALKALGLPEEIKEIKEEATPIRGRKIFVYKEHIDIDWSKINRKEKETFLYTRLILSFTLSTGEKLKEEPILLQLDRRKKKG